MKKFGLDLRVLKTESEKAEGYQHAQKPDEGTGLLFVFDPPQPASFHMRNVSFPLSISFFDSNWKHIKTERMQPQVGVAHCQKACAYAIECNPGDLKMTAQTHPAPTYDKDTTRVDVDFSPDFYDWWYHRGKYKKKSTKSMFRTLRVGETVRTYKER